MRKVLAIFALVAAVFTSCDKLSDTDEMFEKSFTKSMGAETTITSVIENDVWNYEEGDIRFQVRVPSGVKVYANDTTIVAEAVLSHVSFEKNGAEVLGNKENGELIYASGDVEIASVTVQKHSQNYNHTLDKVEGEVEQFWFTAVVKLESGREIATPARNASVIAADSAVVTFLNSDEDYNYYSAKMTYTASIDGKSSDVNGYKTLATVNARPEDVCVEIKAGDKGFDELTYDENGNLKTGKSWMDVIYVYSESGEKPQRYEVVLNFFVKGVARATQYGETFDGIKEIGNGLGTANEGSSRKEGSFITVTSLNQNYNSGLVFDGKSYNKDFAMGYEKAVWSDGEHTFNMPSPAFEGMNNTFKVENMSASNGYERKLNTITLNGSINGKDIKNVFAETELLVKEEKETFTIAVVDSAFVYVNPTTSDTKITIRETGSKGTVREYDVDVNVYNGIDAPEEVTYDVDKFDSKSDAAKLNSTDEYVGKREVGDFTVYRYKMGFTVGSENVDRYFRPFYEKAYHNPTKTWMMWKRYENVTDNGFNTTDLSNQTSGSKTYMRKRYVYAMSATYNGHSDNATASAVLRVQVKEEDNRQTPSWLGAPLWANYTRVQKSEGAKFEDMVVFGYENGVVMAPKNKVDLNLVFAYDQNVADAHGVQKCAKGSCYTGVYKNGNWIPAKCETQNAGKSNETWVYTGKGASHSVMANNASALGIGVDRTWNPKETVTITDGTITVKYSKNNASLSGNDLISLK